MNVHRVKTKEKNVSVVLKGSLSELLILSIIGQLSVASNVFVEATDK